MSHMAGRNALNSGLALFSIALAISLAATCANSTRSPARSIVGDAGNGDASEDARGGDATCDSCFSWQTSLSFEDALPGEPMPTNGMNIAAHGGMLFAGFGTDHEEGNYSQARSYVYRKEASAATWILDATFEPGSGRVAALDEIRFERDGDGVPLPEGPRSLLIAATNKYGRGAERPALRIRDDETDSWSSLAFGEEMVASYNIRAFAVHRDRVTGADLLFVGAGPAPLGIFRGSYDADADMLTIAPAPELVDETSKRGKWFAFAPANGALYGASRTGIYRRTDGPSPSWQKVIDIPRLPTMPGGEVNLEYRGLVAVPSIGWPEPEMLFFYQQARMWRARAGGDHAYEEEKNLDHLISQHIGYPVAMAEAAFNPLVALNPAPFPEPFLFVSFEFVFGDLVPEHLVAPRDPLEAGDMSTSTAFSSVAYYLLRSHDGTYSPLVRMVDPANPDRITIIARDAAASPFGGEEDSIYAIGFNASSYVPSGATGVNGKAWVYRGVTLPEGELYLPLVVGDQRMADRDSTTCQATQQAAWPDAPGKAIIPGTASQEEL